MTLEEIIADGKKRDLGFRTVVAHTEEAKAHNIEVTKKFEEEWNKPGSKLRERVTAKSKEQQRKQVEMVLRSLEEQSGAAYEAGLFVPERVL